MNSEPRYVSDSSEQLDAEAVALEKLGAILGCTLVGEDLKLDGGAKLRVDGINHEHRILCEVYSRIGRLRGAQPHKLASDMLKLLLAERHLGGSWRKIICLADEEAARCLRGRSWLAEAGKKMGFEVRAVELPPPLRGRILAAQRRQVMVNPSVDES